MLSALPPDTIPGPTPKEIGYASLLPKGWRLPPGSVADAPVEARGLTRDGVRLMVSDLAADHIAHATFREVGAFLTPGDLLVINTSGTRPSALPATRQADGASLRLHLSTRTGEGRWVVELRRFRGSDGGSAGDTEPFLTATAGETFLLPGGGSVTLLRPHGGRTEQIGNRVRLWDAALHLPRNEAAYLSQYAEPIRYGYVREPWPLAYYQTAYATEVGSAEMPSAGRAFTPEQITRLVAQGVQFAPLLLHTGVSSQEAHEAPYEEFYRVPEETARAVNAARGDGRRVIAVGTTAVRALETLAGKDCLLQGGEGWTDLTITPDRGLRAVDGLLSGLHEPEATHLWMLEALARGEKGRAHLRRAYQEALREGYLWHEFGDLHLLLAR